MAEYTLFGEYEFRGKWTTPDVNCEPKSGALTVKSSRSKLALDDAFVPLNGELYVDQSRTLSVIHGITTSGEQISLLNPMGAGTELNFNDRTGVHQSEKWISYWTVIGSHTTKETLYAECTFDIPGLIQWLGISKINCEYIDKTDTEPRTTIYTVTGLVEERIYLSAIHSYVIFASGVNHKHDPSGANLSLESAARVCLRPDEPKALTWYLDQLAAVTKFIEFASGSAMGPDHIRAQLVIDTERIDVEVLIKRNDSGTFELKSLHDFLMLRTTLGLDLALALNNWLNSYEAISSASSLAISTIYSEGLWSHIRFLSLMQALEGFHRALLPGTYTSIDRYSNVAQRLYEAIPKDLDSSHRASLKSRIKYGNEYSLSKRLTELVKRLAPEVLIFLLAGEQQVPRSWIDTRNYYTHWDEVSRENILGGQELYEACIRLQELLRALYLDLFGIPKEAMLKVFSNSLHSDIQHIRQLNNAHERKENPEHPRLSFGRITRTPPIEDAPSSE